MLYFNTAASTESQLTEVNAFYEMFPSYPCKAAGNEK